MKNKNYNFEFLEFEKILSIDLWVLKNQDPTNSIKGFKKLFLKFNNFFNILKFFFGSIFRSIFFTPIIKFPKFKNLNIFYIRTFSRPDLVKHSEYYEKIEGTTLCVLDKRKKKFDLTNLYWCFFLLLKYKKLWIQVLHNNKIKFFSLSGFNLFIKLFNSFSDSLKILPVLLKYDKLVSFQEMMPVENILCQIANNNNIKTFGLEHAIGLYKETGDTWERYPVVHYLNTTCQNILCWGELSKKIFEKHSKAQIYIVGKAGLPETENISEGATFVFHSKKCKSANNALIGLSNICENYKIPLSRWYKEKNKDGIFRDGPLRKIIIGCSSNLLLELGFLGFEVYVIKESVLKNFLPKKLIIESISFNAKTIKFSESYPHEIWKEFIACTGKDSVAKYKNIILGN